MDNNAPIGITNSIGEYISFFEPNTTTEYFVTTPEGFTAYPQLYTVSTNSTPQQFTNYNFGLCADSLFYNLQASLNSYTVPRPGKMNKYSVCVKNIGSKWVAASIFLDFSGLGSQYISNISAFNGSIQDNVVTWGVTYLPILQTRCFDATIQLNANTPIGTVLNPKAQVTTTLPLIETTYIDNHAELFDTVVNATLVSNHKSVDKTMIQQDPDLDFYSLQYKIRFQNTDTYATHLEILDTLESNLDIGTFEMVAASHYYILSFPAPNVIKWRFNYINMPDSTSNEPESHGFIVFNINSKTPINLGESVRNRAGIYFDFNEPVITNYAVTSFTVGVHDPFGLGSLPLSIAPNPTQDNITLRYTLTESADSELIITNAQGVVVQSQRLGKQGVGDYALPVDLAGLPAGLYLVTVRVGGLVGVGKVVRL